MTILTFTRNKSIAVTQLQSYLQAVLQIIGASVFIAICSQIKIILPFTLIPITGQTLSILLVGMSLGSYKGFLAVLSYYAQILAGLPVAAGGIIEPLVFLGPKGGYYLGFCAQAYMMGWFMENFKNSKQSVVWVGGFISCLLQLGCGVLVLSQYTGWSTVWAVGFIPFIPVEILKLTIISFFIQAQQIFNKRVI